MADWIITCNPAGYNITDAFEALDEIDWKQSTSIEVGDTVYIYVGKPDMAIRYRCTAVKTDMDDPEIDDIDYVIDDTDYGNAGRYMRLHLEEKYDTDKLKLYELQKNGLKTVQGPSKVPKQLSDYIFASTETLTGQRITRRHAIEILCRAYDMPLTARNLTNIIYEIGKHQSAIFGELNYLAQIGKFKKEGSPAQYYFSPAEELPTPRYFYVFQGRSFDEEYEDGFLWAPKKGKGGVENHHWSRMQEVRKGDVILHGKSSRFVAISIAKSDCYSAPRPNNLSDEWAKDGWRIDTDYFVFPHAIRPVDYVDEMRPLLPEKYGPFDKDGNGNMGYLFACNQELARFLLDATAGMTDTDEHIPVQTGTSTKAPSAKVDTDVELESLLEEKGQVQIDNYIAQFMKKLPEFKEREKELEQLRQQFVSTYTMQKIIGMTKEEYVVGLGKKDSFCYWLENELQGLGNIHGAPANKFGLYYGTAGDDKEAKYRATKKYGSDPDEALEKIKEQIVLLRMAGEKKDLDAIENSDLSLMYRGKLLSTFFPDDYLGIFVDEHLDHFMTKLGITFGDDGILEKQRKLVAWKNDHKEFDDLSNYLFQCFLYSSFGRPFEEEKEEKDLQSLRDKEYPKDYAENIKITIDQWKTLLQNTEVFKEKDLDLIKRFYVCDNHATTCYDLAMQDGVSPSSYITPVVALAKRISEAMDIEPIYGDKGDRVWWRIIFWGRYRDDEHFEWKLQPKLAKAMKALYPELDRDEVNDEEDQELINDLKQASLSSAKEDFEYNGVAKQKSTAVYTNGHKTYPRDRQTAINALAHAHYECEIDAGHPSFIRKNSDKKYTEPHHLVPMAFSDEFKVSLDVEENIVSLCSNCHNQIHYGRDAWKLIKALYEDRKDALKNVGIDVSLQQLYDMYNTKEGADV